MVHRHVIIAFTADRQIRARFVGVDDAVQLDVLFDDGEQGRAALVRDNFRHHLAAAFREADNNRLVRHAAFGLIDLAADDRFVHFDMLGKAAKRAIAVHNRHIFADFVAHAPSRLVGHADLALNFLCRHAAAGRAELEHNKEPVAKAGARPVEGGASGRVNLMATPFARIGPALGHAVELCALAALFAIVPLAVANTHQVIEAAFLGGEAVLKLAKGRCFAHADYLPQAITCRKGIIAFHRAGLSRIAPH